MTLRHPKHRAFTLIEVIAVMVILAIGLLIALPDMDSSHGTYMLQSGANQIMSALQITQAQAISTGVDHGCSFSALDNSFRCYKIEGSEPYPAITHPVRKTPYEIDLDTVPGIAGVAITGVTFTDEKVAFDALGSPDDGGTITLTLGAHSKNIEVAAVTGLMEFTDP